jgi:hypothetical protein
LPGEVRNKIYAYAFQSNPTISTPWTSWLLLSELKRREVIRYKAYRHRHLLGLKLDCYIALPQTCRQIWAETQLLPYKYADYNKTDRHFVLWLEVLDGAAFQMVWKSLSEEQKKKVLELTMYPWRYDQMDVSE